MLSKPWPALHTTHASIHFLAVMSRAELEDLPSNDESHACLGFPCRLVGSGFEAKATSPTIEICS